MVVKNKFGCKIQPVKNTNPSYYGLLLLRSNAAGSNTTRGCRKADNNRVGKS